MVIDTKNRILKHLLKNISVKPTITSLAKDIEFSRVWMWKYLKRLEKDKLILLSSVGTGKTCVYTVSLNWKNLLIEKILAVALIEDAIKEERWSNNFYELKDKVDFLMIYGSIISSSKEAKDIDILIVADKKRVIEIDKSIKKIQKTQLKKIHSITFTYVEMMEEIKKGNSAFIDAFKKGIVLFGQEEFIKFVKEI